eukprot:1565066-Rhodomonas_salina.1
MVTPSTPKMKKISPSIENKCAIPVSECISVDAISRSPSTARKSRNARRIRKMRRIRATRRMLGCSGNVACMVSTAFCPMLTITRQ